MNVNLERSSTAAIDLLTTFHATFCIFSIEFFLFEEKFDAKLFQHFLLSSPKIDFESKIDKFHMKLAFKQRAYSAQKNITIYITNLNASQPPSIIP